LKSFSVPSKARQTRPWGQHDVGHEGIVTGRDELSLRSFSGGSGSTLARRKPCSARKRSVSDKASSP